MNLKTKYKIILFFSIFITCVTDAQEMDIKSIICSLTGEKIYSMRDGAEKWVKVVALNGHDYIATILVDKKAEQDNGGSDQDLSFLLVDKISNKIVIKTPCVYPDLKKWIFIAKLKNDNSDQLVLLTSTGSMLQSWRVFDFKNGNFSEVGLVKGSGISIVQTDGNGAQVIKVYNSDGSGAIEEVPLFYRIKNEKIVDCGNEFSGEYLNYAKRLNALLKEKQNAMNVLDFVYINNLIITAYVRANQKESAQQWAVQARAAFPKFSRGGFKKNVVDRAIDDFDSLCKENGLIDQ